MGAGDSRVKTSRIACAGGTKRERWLGVPPELFLARLGLRGASLGDLPPPPLRLPLPAELRPVPRGTFLLTLESPLLLRSRLDRLSYV